MTTSTTLLPAPDPITLSLLARSPRIEDQALARAASPDFPAWLGHVRSASTCTRPIRLRGQMLTVEATTGRVLTSLDTANLPDGVIYKPCGNRRETVCPACSKVYKRDAFQIVRSMLAGGNGVPETVVEHPGVFATFTAPSFGEVHTRIVARHTCKGRDRCDCRAEPCHARRDAPRCPHGRPLACFARHEEGDRILGTPLCLDCYDHDAQVVWNLKSAELWRRTTIAITRQLDRLVRRLGLPEGCVKLCFSKAAEFQIRGVIHFHAIIRLDGVDPDDPDVVVPPPAGVGVLDLVDAVERAAPATVFTTATHPAQPEGWRIAWGTQLEVRPIMVDADGPVTDLMAANYIAKYATKSTEVTGHVSGRLNGDTIDLYADPEGSHTERLIDACWTLGRPREWRRLRRAAHMFGFAGHFLTKSRRHRVTFRLLRDRRVVFARAAAATPPPADQTTAAATEAPTTLVVNFLEFVGAGWRTPADAMLATTSQALAREYQAAALAEIATRA